MMNKIKLLLVEDEPVLASIIQENLERHDFHVVCADNGRLGWEAYRIFQPHACLVDIMLPEKDGLSLVKEIRKIDEETPVIFLTAKTAINDVIDGLKYADDYIKKPFSLEELKLRIKNLVRRAVCQPPVQKNTPGIFTLGSYTFDYHRQELRHRTGNIRLSLRDADILRMLSENANKTTYRKMVLEEVWGGVDYYNARSMDVYMSKLRRYLQYDASVQLITVRNQGYRLVCNQPY